MNLMWNESAGWEFAGILYLWSLETLLRSLFKLFIHSSSSIKPFDIEEEKKGLSSTTVVTTLHGNIYFLAIHCRLCTVAGNSITHLGLHSTKIPSFGQNIWTPPSSSWNWSLVKSLCWEVKDLLCLGSEYLMHKASWVKAL